MSAQLPDGAGARGGTWPRTVAVSIRFHAGTEIAEAFRAGGVVAYTYKDAAELQGLLGQAPVDIVLELNIHPDIHAVCARCGLPYVAWAFDSGSALAADMTWRAEDHIFLHNREDAAACRALGQRVRFLPFSAGTVFWREPRRTDHQFEVLAILNSYRHAVGRNESDYQAALRQLPPGHPAREQLVALHAIAEQLLVERVNDLTSERLQEELAARIRGGAITLFEQAPRKLAQFAQGLGQELAFRQRTGLVTELACGRPVDVFGDAYWRVPAAQLSNIRYHGWAAYERLPDLYNAAKISINLTQPQCLGSIPQRVFHVLASGGFLLTNGGELIWEHFRPGVHLDTFDTLAELREKCNFYLRRSDVRDRIAAAGRAEFLRHHTMQRRLGHICETVSWGKS
ncbi:MAG: glycosyltransferase family 1 protein [Kiritimatiellae bacterium]|nr:glycosyltransferase family 1 protein [Kiritimatiellia bacterium]